MNKSFLAITTGLMTIGLVSAASAEDLIQVRLVNAVPNAPEVSVKVGDKPLFENVKQNAITPYQTMKEEDDQKVTINFSDGRQLETKDKLDFDKDNDRYTILITPDDAGQNPKVVVLRSKAKNVDQDKVQITLINASPANKSLNLKLNDDTKIRGVDYGDQKVDTTDPGVYNAGIVSSKGDNQQIATKSVALAGGTAATILVTCDNQVKVVNDNSPESELTSSPASGGVAPSTTTTSGTATSYNGANTNATAAMTTPAMSM